MKINFFLFFFIPFFILAQQTVEVEPPPPAPISVDSVDSDYYEKGEDVDSLLSHPYETSNKAYPKKLDVTFKKKYRTEEFDYSEVKPKESFWDRLMRRIESLLESIFGKSMPGKNANFTRNLLYVAAVIIAAFVLYFLFKFLVDKDGNFIFGKKNKKLNVEVEPLHENIHEINFEENIAQLEYQQEYRYAVRYLFLQTLKNLEDRKIIQWNPEKTNHDYLLEIKNPEHKKQYDQLSYIFDYVWYGEFDVNHDNYYRFKEQFTKAKFV